MTAAGSSSRIYVRMLSRFATMVLAVALSGPAAAAVYSGSWGNPPFGAPFAADLGWRGVAEYVVPDSCELAGTGSVSNVPACSGAAAVTSAKVELFDTNGPADLLATMIMAPGSMTILTLFYLAGQLDQLDTAISSLVMPVGEPGVNLGDYGIPVGFTTFGLQFTASGPRLHFQTCVPGTNCVSGSNNATDFPPDFRIARVPEPASITLAGLALVSLAAARRRRGATDAAA